VRGRAATAALLAALTTACGSGGEQDDVPLDGAECTAGTVTPGATVAGEVTTASCLKFDEGFQRPALVESWRLRTGPATMYIVRLDPVGTAPVLHLVAVERGDDGEAHFATGYSGEFQEHDEPPSDALSQEMVLPSTGSAEVAIRVIGLDSARVGAYELRVLACPLSTLSVGGPAREVDLATSCQLVAPNFDPDSVRAAFFTFRAEQAGIYRYEASWQSGTGSLRGLLAGPGPDTGAWLPGSIWDPVGPGRLLSSTVALPVPGQYTVIIGSPVDSNAVFQVKVTRPSTP
jgi:hypothetical protein